MIYLNYASSPVRVIFSIQDLKGRQYEVLGSITASGNYRQTTDNMLMESLKRQAANMGANVLLFEGFSNNLPTDTNLREIHGPMLASPEARSPGQ
ncbi:MAG: hypothetical protein OXO51_15520 [Gemmatimonadota bacterium]|nr:hypothetical protein [Gemmatimonadota bacterium]